MIKKNIKNIFIILIGTFILNLVFYFLNIKLGYENSFIFFAIITGYSLLTMYNLLFGNIQIFNKIYMFMVGIFGFFISWGEHYPTGRVTEENKDSFEQVRELDMYNSKTIYLMGNITILTAIYFIYTIIISKNVNPIFFLLLALGLLFPIYYVPLYETLTLKISKTDLIKLILLIILIIITSIVLVFVKFKYNAGIIVLVYFCLLMSLIFSYDKKKLFITNLVLLIIFILVPIFIFLWLF